MGRTHEIVIAALSSIGFLIAACTATVVSKKEGMVEYAGTQSDIFRTGKASRVISLKDLKGLYGLYAMGPIEGLDGEITVFNSKPYITKVKENDFVLDTSFDHGAFFLVWSEQTKWKDIAIPNTVKGYADLQRFVKAQAQTAGIDTAKPFPFLVSGTPAEIKWHINVDRTDGKPITTELFLRSKENFISKDEPVDIIGFYSEHHAGIFLTRFAPDIKEGSGMENAIHIHFVSRVSKAAGHIDSLILSEGMVLRFPNP